MRKASIGAMRPDLTQYEGSSAASRRGARHKPLRSTWRAMADRPFSGNRSAGSSSNSTCFHRGLAVGRGHGRTRHAHGFGRVRQRPPSLQSATDCMGYRLHAKAKLPVLRWALRPTCGDNPNHNRKGEIEMLMILLMLATMIFASSRISSLTGKKGTRERKEEGLSFDKLALPVSQSFALGSAKNCICPPSAKISAIWRIAWLGVGMAFGACAKGTDPICRRKTQLILGGPIANRIKAISKRRSYRSGSGNKAWLDGWGKPRPYPAATVARPFRYPVGVA